MFKNRPKFLIMRSFSSAAMTPLFQAVNPNGIEFPCLDLIFNNRSNQDIIVSFDGTNQHLLIAANSFQAINSNAISAATPDPVKFPKGTIVYVTGTAGIGTFYVSGLYLEA